MGQRGEWSDTVAQRWSAALLPAWTPELVGWASPTGLDRVGCAGQHGARSPPYRRLRVKRTIDIETRDSALGEAHRTVATLIIRDIRLLKAFALGREKD